MRKCMQFQSNWTNRKNVRRWKKSIDCLPSKPWYDLLIKPLLNYLGWSTKQHVFVGVWVVVVRPKPLDPQGIGCFVMVDVEPSGAFTFDCGLILICAMYMFSVHVGLRHILLDRRLVIRQWLIIAAQNLREDQSSTTPATSGKKCTPMWR